MPILLIILGVILVALIVLTVIYLRKKKQAKAAEAGEGDVAAPGGDEISVLIHQAEAKLSAAKLEVGGKVANLPVYIVMGEPGSTKTSVMLHSGLEPELLAGQTNVAGNVAPTRTANFWFSRRSIFAEAGGALPTDAGRWKSFVKRLQPRASVVGKGEQAPRAVVVCYDCENFTKSGSGDIVVAAARTLRARLGEISQTMGINLPVYALFTKIDRLPFFTEFVRNLNNDESTQVLGVTLPMVFRRTDGVYAEEEGNRLNYAFERLFHALADARPEFLGRETDGTKLPSAYEFPREFRKIRPVVVQFLVDLCRPSQLTVGPFLRGFYFTGVRPVIINEAAPVVAAPQQAAYGGPAGATGIFNMRAQAADPAAAPAPAPVAGSKKVPQWVFLSHLFNDILLKDEAAKGASGASTKTSMARRILFICAASLCFLLCVFFTISFFNNRGLEGQVRDAAKGIASSESTGADLASVDSLRKLETLRQSVQTLVTYHREGSPLFYRWGLYCGDDLYPEARRLYFEKFRQLLFGQTQGSILQNLRTLPATPGPDYQPTYDALKAYLITTSYHDKSTRLFLSPVLMRWWTGTRTVDPDRVQLAQKQFDFYSEELKEENPFSRENDTLAIERARTYLKQFAGTERVYAYMLAQADQAGTPINFNRQFPGSAQAVVDTHDVRGAFSKGGWNFMKNAFGRADQFFSGEAWVLGDQGSAIGDRAKLEADLRARYYNDFVKEWTAYVRAATVLRYTNLKDAATKLKMHSSNQAPLLELSSLASQNTAVDDPSQAKLFQPVQAVTPPEVTDRYVGPANQNYVNALVQLQSSIESIADQPPNDAASAQSLGVAKQAESTVIQLSQAFHIDSPVQRDVQALLMAPIVYAEALLKGVGAAELNAGGGGLCKQISPVMAKYPFNPNAQVEATLPDIDSVFKPKDGALWHFVEGPLAKYVQKQGSQYAAVPAGTVTIQPPFLAWVNRAAAFTDAAFKDGSADPHFSYTIKPEFSADLESVKLTVDGQSAPFTAAAAAAKPLVWPGSAHGVQMVVTFQGGKEFIYPSYDGLWAVFRWVADADSKTGSVISMTLRSGKQGNPVRNPSNNQPITVRLDIGANPPIFDRGYFSTLGCVAGVAR